MKNYSVQSILDWLETKNYLSNRRGAEAFILTQASINKAPLYIHVLMAFGAIVGCVCLIGLLYVSKLISFDDERALLFAGLVFILLSLGCYYVLRYQTALLQSFGLQSALIFMVAGKILFVLGFRELVYLLPLSKPWLTTLGIFIVSAPTYFIFPNQIDRFLSSLALLSSILNNLTLQQDNILHFSYFAALLFLTGVLYIWRHKSLAWAPLGYAAIFTLLIASIIMLAFLEPGLMFNQPWVLIIPPVFYSLSIGLGLIILCLSLLKEKKAILHLPALLACIVIAILSFIVPPGILLSMGLLLVGYAKHEMSLSILGSVCLALFLIAFYYSLPFSLEYKSALLVSTGVILLASRFVIKLLRWDDAS